MISSDDEVGQAGTHDPTLLLYDFFKHLTTLCLVALGGVLSLSQASVKIDQDSMILIAGLIGTGGVLALVGLDAIVKARTTGQPLPKSLRWTRAASVLMFGLGTGAFASAFLDAVG